MFFLPGLIIAYLVLHCLISIVGYLLGYVYTFIDLISTCRLLCNVRICLVRADGLGT